MAAKEAEEAAAAETAKPARKTAARKKARKDDATLALQWDSHVRVFSTDRPLPPGFRNGPIRWQIDTLAWSFHAEKKAGDTGGTSPRRSAAEVAQALGEALAVDMPLRPNPLTERFPALADYLAFLNRLPRR